MLFRSVGLARGQHAALVDDGRPIANAQGFSHIVVGDQHTNASGFEKRDDALNLDHGDRINARKRLVKQNKLGI